MNRNLVPQADAALSWPRLRHREGRSEDERGGDGSHGLPPKVHVARESVAPLWRTIIAR